MDCVQTTVPPPRRGCSLPEYAFPVQTWSDRESPAFRYFGFTPHDGERNSVSPSNARSPSRHLAPGLADGGPDVSPGCGQPCPAGHKALAGLQESKNLIVGAGSGLEPLTNPA